MQKLSKKFRRKTTSGFLAFLIVLQTVVGIFAPVDFSLEPPFVEPQETLAAANWYGTAGWGYRKKITIDHTKVATSTQTNFPVLISRIDDDWRTVANDGKVGQDDGGDFMFTSSDGQAKLSHEIDKYSSSTGELIAWVRIPTLSASADTEIYMYYGNADCADQWDAAGGTWDSSFVMVQHMNEDPSDADPAFKDSAGSNDGMDYGDMTAGDQVAGQIDGSLDFDGADDYVEIADESNFDFGTGDWILGCWFKSDLAHNGTLAGKGADGAGGIRYKIYVLDTGAIAVEIDDNGVGIGKVNVTSTATTYGNDGLWHYIVGVKDGNNLRLYIDGTEDAISPANITGMASLNTDYPVVIGKIYNSAGAEYYQFFDGIMDEVRISSTARSADWIETEYNNQSDPATFYEIGIQEVASPTALTSWSYRKAITIDESKIPDTLATNLENFPVLINLTSDDNLATHAQADFDDILFTSNATAWDTGTENDKLAHEIESYNSTTGALQAWVNIPILDYNNDTVIYMYYGNGSTASQQNMEEVWDGNTKLVQHLQENPAGGATPDGTDEVFDSTNNSNDGNTGGTMLAEDQVTGQIDGGLDFDGTDDYVEANTTDDSLDLTQPWTLSCWFKIRSYGDYAPAAGFSYKAGNEYLTIGHDNSDPPKLKIATAGKTPGTGSVLSTDIYYHAVLIWDGTKAIAYLDGVYEYEVTPSPAITWNDIDTFLIGADYVTGGIDQFFDGIIDEVRISSTARSADWIATEYNNQSDLIQFYELGLEQTLTIRSYSILRIRTGTDP